MRNFIFSILITLILVPPSFCENSYKKSGHSNEFTAVMTITTDAYTSGDCLGGLVTFQGINTGGQDKLLIQSITIADAAIQDANIDVIFFDENPSNSTFTNNAACDIADADLSKVVSGGCVSVTEYFDYNDNSTGVTRNLAIPVNSKALFAVLVVRATPTYVATTDITFNVGLI